MVELRLLTNMPVARFAVQISMGAKNYGAKRTQILNAYDHTST